MNRPQSEQPVGTVTLVFTDIEGSTRLLHELGTAGYKEALAEHRRIVREACAGYQGYEVDYEGDAFFYAFASAEHAASAVSEAMYDLKAGPIAIRVGIHTGSPEPDPPKYVGLDVHMAARIMSAGHGGQVVVSPTTAALLRPGDTVSQGFVLLELGSHRLKDLGEPISLYQLGEGSFPPLKTIANTNLPTPASSFLGREEELYAADALLQETRLLTVSGPGGQGKTRFALELARRAREERFSDYPDGVFSCFLASLRDPSLVLATIAQTLNVTEQPGSSALDGLASHLEGKRMLLLLDNLEHLLASASELSQLLQRAEGLTLLVTSREVLRIAGETAYALPALHEEEGIALFCARAGIEPAPEIAELCSRLEGLPLAIELAAARLAILTPPQLLERLSERLDLLKGGRDADPRQQTLRATIEWSYDLLSEEEQRLFRALSVFAGGCTLEAAEAVAGADLDTLHSLVDKSLLRFTEGRFWMLETIREYAGEQLAHDDEASFVRDGQLAWVAREAHARAVPARNHDAAAHAFLSAEQANIREALGWAIHRGDSEAAQRIFGGTWFHWFTRGHAREGDEWAARVVAMPSEPTVLYAWSLALAGEFPRYRAEPARARPLKERAIEILEQLADDPDIESMLAALHSDLSDVLSQLGVFEEALSHAERALATRRRLGDPKKLAHALDGLATVAERRGSANEALALYQEAFELSEKSADPTAAESLLGIGRLRLALGDVAGARAAAEDALERGFTAGDGYVRAIATTVLGRVALEEEDFPRAVELLARARVELDETGLRLDEADQVETALSECRSQLGHDRFERAMAAGLAAAQARGS